jgi:hypothetical protein
MVLCSTSHDQLADTVQRLGSSLDSTFIDGGILQCFENRNFIAPPAGGQSIKVDCPLDHPATELTLLVKAVS